MGETDRHYDLEGRGVDKGRGRKFDSVGIRTGWERNRRRFIHVLSGCYPSSDRAEPVLGIAEGNIRGLGHLLPQGAKGERGTTAQANSSALEICGKADASPFLAPCGRG
jgi:hypothetical protein